MTKKLSECSYCKRPADEDGSIFHVGGCTALQEVPLNRLQYDGLTQEIERLQKREAQFAAALYAVKEVVAKDSPQWLLADQLARMMLSAPPSEPNSPQAPIAKITVRESGAGHYAPNDVSVSLYAPGLPPGDHDLYCEPEAVAPYMRAAKSGGGQ